MLVFRRCGCSLAVLFICFSASLESKTISPHGLLQAVPVQDGADFPRRLITEKSAKGVEQVRRTWFESPDRVHVSDISSAGEIFNEVALKSSDGEKLGYSLAAGGNILGLGWGGRGLLSSNANLKGWFYTVEEGMIGLASVFFDPISTATSADLACFSYENGISCFALNNNRTHTRLTSTDHWVPASDLLPVYPDICSFSRDICFGLAITVWERSIAVSAIGPGGARFVSVFGLLYGSGEPEWDCLTGCGGNLTNVTEAEVQSTEPSFGAALAMHGDLLAVGVPGAREGEGAVQLWVAAAVDRREWRLVQTESMQGARSFGHALAMDGGLLVVGAPGAEGHVAGVHVYRIERDAVQGVRAVRLCEVLDGEVAHRSRLGWAVAMQRTVEGAVVAVGAPGTSGAGECQNVDYRANKVCSSRVYMIAVVEEDGECVARDFIMQAQSEGYGSSVAMTESVVFAGAPDYLKRNWDNTLTSGLIYIYTYCGPGEFSETRYANGGLVRTCSPCADGTWSEGGHWDRCTSCVPAFSTVVRQCEFTCLAGYFGEQCRLCSQSELADPAALPANASWVDGEATCRWACDLGFLSTDGVSCAPCARDAAASNGDWVPETCGWTCREGFFDSANTSTPDCVPCSVLQARDGLPPPANAYWVDGWPTCEFVPRVGYSCNGTVCEACPAIPAAANWSDWAPQVGSRCGYACLERHFGHPELEGVCVRCPELQAAVKPPALRPTLPARAEWLDGLLCTADSWACAPGHSRSSFPPATWSAATAAGAPAATGYCCPHNISDGEQDAAAAPCGVRCLEGFWWDMALARCAACDPKPEHTHWRQGNCTFGPDVGYFCNASRVCSRCEGLPSVAKPEDAEWILQAVGEAACPYQCSAGSFGHPAVHGECMPCSEYMTVHVPNAWKPRFSHWDDSALLCNADSWACDDAFRESSSLAYCCPEQIPNSSPSLGASPCDVECDLGFYWHLDDAACRTCGAKVAHSAWNASGNCRYDCVQGYYGIGTPGFWDSCLRCSEYRDAIQDPPPPNAVWDNGGGCGDEDWVCVTGFDKSLEAQPPGCCPRSMGPGGVAGGDEGKCEWECVAGFQWDAVFKDCVRCDGWEEGAVPPLHAHWNDSLCSFQCDAGYKAEPPSPASPDRCVDCPTQAAEAGWSKPADAEWLTGPQPQCTAESWACAAGFVRHGLEDRCCPSAEAYVPEEAAMLETQQRGGWVPGECQWQCADGFHPREPRREWRGTGRDCLTCTEYLETAGISCDSEGSGCAGKQVKADAATCSAAAQAVFGLARITAREFGSDAQVAFLIATEASLEASVPGLELDWKDGMSIISYHDKAVRRGGRRVGKGDGAVSGAEMRGGEIQRRAATVLEVTVAVEEVDVAVVQEVEDALSGGSVEIESNLRALGYTELLVLPDVVVELGPAKDTVLCEEGFKRNEFTGECCPAAYFSAPEHPEWGPIDAVRYRWHEDGCTWTCRDGYRGTHCYTCHEYNELLQRFKPPNSAWVPDSEDCSEWACVQGFVKSSTGFSCVSLSQLYKVCAANHRCADCLKQEDCVWCGEAFSPHCDANQDEDCSMGACVPGVGSQITNEGWRYYSDGNLSAMPECQGEYCTDECQHRKCSDCVRDRACGWCVSSERCMMGDNIRPEREVCKAGWLFANSQQCGTDQGLWLIGLVVACVAMLVVGLCCCFCIIKVRIRIQQQEQQNLQREANQADVRRITSRFLATFPTFKYNGNRNASPNNSCGSRQSADDDDDEAPSCSICLGEFAEGEECRMLPCLHVFHRPCIDQWLGVSHECPLCKQSVINQGNAHLVHNNSSAFVQNQGLMFAGQVPAGSVAAAPGGQPDGAQPGGPPTTNGPIQDLTLSNLSAGGGREVEMVSAITFSPSPLHPSGSSGSSQQRAMPLQARPAPDPVPAVPALRPEPADDLSPRRAQSYDVAQSLSPQPMESAATVSPRADHDGAPMAGRRGPMEVELGQLGGGASGPGLPLQLQSADESEEDAPVALPQAVMSPAPAHPGEAGSTAAVGTRRGRKDRRDKEKKPREAREEREREEPAGAAVVHVVGVSSLASSEELPAEALEGDAPPAREGPGGSGATGAPASGAGREVAC